ncbi:carboxylesterase family protein [Mycobacterium sp. MYCO198283]|uniref:carboxylesterase family protein n=1 Tax=Mycobacterium sp. MYCO198283 TaxID=2883505 RepID=UPI001E4F4FD1|nr:carboxylesterase family protein [Mycobacterium sp. MYCO198283]MCG5433460.1 carboxylesterase family protein [Mycobacterium sp. MYCO198283]
MCACGTHRLLPTEAGPLLVEDDGRLVRGRGIGYATAARFAAPVATGAHAAPRDATARGPACPQRRSRLDFVAGPVTDGLAVSEACQVLSVTAPSGAARLPVMVWFHGGAYLSGSGEAAKYDADALALEGQVVVVRVTYRLGIFGYLNPDPDGEANLGLRDQIAALRWVHQHIAAFGGDPARVTVFGQSAGGDAVLSLILSEHTAGLFIRAILQSAPLGLRHGRSAMTAAMRRAVAAALGGAEPGSATVAQLLDAQDAAVAAARRFGAPGGLPFAPIAGADPLPAAADERSRLAERARDVEILVGHTRDDAAPFVALDRRAHRLAAAGAPGRFLTRRLGRAMTERIFGRPAATLAATWESHGGTAATYRVDWAPPDAPLGACHCIELPLLFGAPDAWEDAPMLGARRHPVPDDVAHGMRSRWAAFAHGGVAALPATAMRIDSASG